MAIPDLTRTTDGRERQFAVNYLGPAELTLRLHGALAAAGSARVVMVSSSAHLMAPVDLDDPHFRRRPYEAWTAYAQSKTALLAGVTGRYFEDGNEASIQPQPAPGKTGVAAYAIDEQLAGRLGRETERQLALSR
jgi:hypothetical protein